MKCASCGEPLEAGDRFCSSCGHPVPEADDTGVLQSVSDSGSQPAVGSGRGADIPSGGALLVVHRGPGQGSEFLLPATADVIGVGRTPESDVFLDDVTVSRRHAEFRRGAEGWSVRDVGSLNGTYVNRVRVDDQRLRGGDEVQIGKFRFVFLVDVDPAG
jgi:pSer/pThr/pTyr-binding forkhead associated (FHA) protein